MKFIILKNHLRVLLIITILDSLILLVRNWITDSSYFNFLFWNLFLGLVPLLIAVFLYYYSGRLGTFFIIIGSFLWLLFYPNAPYMITDIIHVNENSPTHFHNLVIYDALIIFLMALLALCYGLYSMKLMKALFAKTAGKTWTAILINICIIISSFGIYLGRILRLNSWDIFTRPLYVLETIADHLFPFSKNPTTYAIIFLFSFIQFSLLIMIKDIDGVNAPVQQYNHNI